MSPAKVVATLAHYINCGIGQDHYYNHKDLKIHSARAFWNKDKDLCFEYDGKIYKLKVIEES